MSEKILLHERTLPDGSLEKTWLELEQGSLWLHIEGEPKKVVPPGVLDAVMRRYGKPLADEVTLGGPSLDVGRGAISVLRYRPRYDVIAKDYLVYAASGEAPIAELATSVMAALVYLLWRDAQQEKLGGDTPAAKNGGPDD